MEAHHLLVEAARPAETGLVTRFEHAPATIKQALGKIDRQVVLKPTGAESQKLLAKLMKPSFADAHNGCQLARSEMAGRMGFKIGNEPFHAAEVRRHGA